MWIVRVVGRWHRSSVVAGVNLRSLVRVYIVSISLVPDRLRLTHRGQLDSLVDLVQRQLDIEARNSDVPFAHDLLSMPLVA